MGREITTEHINETMNKGVADKVTVPSQSDLMHKLQLHDNTAYIQAPAFVANPYSLLGRVIEVRKNGSECPTKLNDINASIEFSPIPIKGVVVEEASKLKEPILRSSIIADQKLCASVSFLSYLNAQLDSSSYFSLMVFDQATGLVDVQNENYQNNFIKWKSDHQSLLEDPDVCYLYAIVGMVQKNIVRKKYIKFNAGAKGGAYGININGELATSTEEYSLDIIFGITPAIIKRPSKTLEKLEKGSLDLDTDSLRIFTSISGSTITVTK